MKNFYILSDLTPEINFIVPDFNQYVNGLTEHFGLTIVLFFSLILLAVLSYYFICILLLFWHRLTGYQYQEVEQDYTLESSSEA